MIPIINPLDTGKENQREDTNFDDKIRFVAKDDMSGQEKCKECNMFVPVRLLKYGRCSDCRRNYVLKQKGIPAGPSKFQSKDDKIEKAQDRKEKSIYKYTDKRELSIAWSSSIRDAVAWMTQHPDWKKELTDKERESWFVERQKWFYAYFTEEKQNEQTTYEPVKENEEAQIESQKGEELPIIPF